jgi:hypothetical protein
MNYNFSSSDSDDDDDITAVTTVITNTIMMTDLLFKEDKKVIESKKKRGSRRKFHYSDALRCLNRDYLGSVPKFNMKEFESMFRISKSRFQKLMEDVKKMTDNKYYAITTRKCASFEAKLLLPIKVLAFGVANHCFNDYLQMSVSAARECIRQFHLMFKKLYEGEYLRLPTKSDIKSIVKLHKHAHQIDGMFGSLDCMHTYWKNCPKAWQGQFKGKEEMASIVLEGICDYHTWFWHASYGYAGTLNDLNILNLSPFLLSLTDGSFSELEKEVVPYQIGDEQFHQLFILVDGIYPTYSRFVKPIPSPSGEDKSNYTEWQESSRKDIERAFGNLQSQWHWVRHPIHLHQLDDIARRLASCIILHNMLVSDRVMGDINATYNPAFNVADVVDNLVTNTDVVLVPGELQNAIGSELQCTTGLRQMNAANKELIRTEWENLNNQEENQRLYKAIYDVKNRNHSNN